MLVINDVVMTNIKYQHDVIDQIIFDNLTLKL